MDTPVICPHCGYVQPSLIDIRGSAKVMLRGVSFACQRCHVPFRMEDGLYNSVGRVVAALSAPGVTREDVRRLREMAVAVKSGRLGLHEASDEIAGLTKSLVDVWDWANAQAGALGLLISIIALALTIQGMWSGDDTAEKQFAVTQQILQELQKQREPAWSPPLHVRTPAVMTTNRHQRRKDQASGRRSKK